MTSAITLQKLIILSASSGFPWADENLSTPHVDLIVTEELKKLKIEN